MSSVARTNHSPISALTSTARLLKKRVGVVILLTSEVFLTQSFLISEHAIAISLIIVGSGLLFLLAICVLASGLYRPRKPRPIKYDGKLHDMEVDRVLVHPVRKSDAELDVVWKVTDLDHH
jgi:hypothetical protein